MPSTTFNSLSIRVFTLNQEGSKCGTKIEANAKPEELLRSATGRKATTKIPTRLKAEPLMTSVAKAVAL
jgi:hypothetical protein